MLEVNPGLIVWTIVSFILLLFVLKRVAWKSILEALQSREESIRVALDHAEEARVKTEKILEEQKTIIHDANEKTIKLINEGRAVAEQTKSEIIVQAHQSAKTMLETAREQIVREKEAALSQIRDEVAKLAILTTEKMIDEVLDDKRRQQLIDTSMNKLPTN
ncbi:MAG: F0F1 ATP synthase subunit B [Bacteroidetes bacterium]|nr:F0F1 ATP synthase subunit B [Bacteroidota bacterium]